MRFSWKYYEELRFWGSSHSFHHFKIFQVETKLIFSRLFLYFFQSYRYMATTPSKRRSPKAPTGETLSVAFKEEKTPLIMTPKQPANPLVTVGLIIAWYCSNIGVLLLNKYLLSNYGFKFPIFLTMSHMMACSFLSYLAISWMKVAPPQVGVFPSFWGICLVFWGFPLPFLMLSLGNWGPNLTTRRF